MALLVIYNPACGAGRAQTTFETQVIPRLAHHGRIPNKVVATTHPGHAGEVVVEFLATSFASLTIVLGSGDGTLHEIADAINKSSTATAAISLVLVPCGTANALYWSLFPPSEAEVSESESMYKSLDAFLSPSPAYRPLSFAKTSLSSSSSPSVRESIAVVVASTSLHASILHDSESLRSSHPGIERFKIAAQQNITRWYDARIRFFPPSGFDSVQVYNPCNQQFEPWVEKGLVELSGPVAYFLSTVNVDRLESAFRITPLRTKIWSQEPVLDVVLLRPERDETVGNLDEKQQAFAKRTYDVLAGAYQDGAHIDMRYHINEPSEQDGARRVVEYLRCSQWEWIPKSGDDPAHLVCVDGEIVTIESGGKATCSVTDNIRNSSISVLT